MMKNSLRRLLFITGCAFSFVVLSFTLLPTELVPDLSSLALQQTFFICLGAAIAAEISASFTYRNEWSCIFCTYFAVALAVFLLGSVVFNLIPVRLNVYSYILISVLLIYIIVYFAVYKMNKNDADTINKQLKKREKDVE